MAYTNRNHFKVRFEQTDEELQKAQPLTIIGSFDYISTTIDKL